MKAKHLLPLAALALPLLVSARPAYPGLITYVGSDGETIQYRIHGDEYFSYITDTEGMLMKFDANGVLNYEFENSQKIKATPEVIENMMQSQQQEAGDSPLRAPSRMASLDSDGRTTYPAVGETHSLVILMQFSDIKFQENSPAQIKSMLNDEGYNLYGSQCSCRDFYIYNSNGQYTPVFDVTSVVTLPKTSAYYVGNNKYANFKEAVKYALDAVNSEVDFSKYDYDNDGIVDTVYIFYAGYGQADTGLTNVIWPHASSLAAYNYVYDGVKVGPYACSNELNGQGHYTSKDLYLDGPGTFVHEFGHVLGMPDLYDVYYTNNGQISPGNWDVMDDGTYNNDGYCPPNLSAYEKWMYKWIEYEKVTDDTHYDLKTIHDGGKALRIPVIKKSGAEVSSEYFILESRTQDGNDTYLNDKGMLIWHIDYGSTYWSSNQVNTVAAHPRVSLVAADGTANWANGSSGSPSYAAWPGTTVNNVFLTPNTDITLNAFTRNLQSSTGSSYITSISYNEDESRSEFDYNVITEAPDLVTTMHAPARTVNSSGAISNGFVLSWDPVEDADAYMLTVYRYNTAGNVIYESGCNEKILAGTDNFKEFANLTTTKMGFEYHAYVRVLKGIPAEEKSNEVVFTPKNLTNGYDAVEEIALGTEGGDNVYALNGGIVAPAGSQIYTLSGIAVKNNSNLPAGIYIVRTANGKATKVTVK